MTVTTSGGPNGFVKVTADIGTHADGRTGNDKFSVSPGRLVGLIFPSLWTAANLTFYAGVDQDDTLYPLYDEGGNLVTVTGAPGRAIGFSNPNVFLGFPVFQLQSGTPGVPVQQGAIRNVILLAQRLYTG